MLGARSLAVGRRRASFEAGMGGAPCSARILPGASFPSTAQPPRPELNRISLHGAGAQTCPCQCRLPVPQLIRRLTCPTLANAFPSHTSAPRELSDIRAPNKQEPGRNRHELGGSIRQQNTEKRALARVFGHFDGGTVNLKFPQAPSEFVIARQALGAGLGLRLLPTTVLLEAVRTRGAALGSVW